MRRRVTIATASRAPPRTPWKPPRYSTSSTWQRRRGVRCSSPAHRRACRHLVRDPMGVDRPAVTLGCSCGGPQPPRAAGALMRTETSPKRARTSGSPPSVADDRSTVGHRTLRRSSPRLDGSIASCLAAAGETDWAVNEEEPHPSSCRRCQAPSGACSPRCWCPVRQEPRWPRQSTTPQRARSLWFSSSISSTPHQPKEVP